MSRVERLLQRLEEENLDGLLLLKTSVLRNQNVRYITGFTGSTAYVLISKKRRVLLTDARYDEQAAEECPEFEVLRHGKVWEMLQGIISELGLSRVAYDASGLTAKSLEIVQKSIKGVEWVSTDGLINQLRSVKEPEEIERISVAAQICDKLFEHALSKVRAGMTERELGLEFEIESRRLGADGLAFDLIVVSGKRSSHQHGAPSDKVMEVGDFVTLDFGARYQGYCSDMTRTIVIGKADSRQREVYDTVKRAQEKGVELVKDGAIPRDITASVCAILDDAGFAEYASRGVGHGVGLDIHELPYIGGNEGPPLATGNIVTVEPGIYIPGWGGVRIEDLVLVTDEGPKRLTTSTKELIEVL